MKTFNKKCKNLPKRVQIARERNEERAKTEREEYFAQKRADKLFSEFQGMPCPKRQGRANGVSDMGKYVNKRRSFGVDEYASAVARLREYTDRKVKSLEAKAFAK